MKCGAFPEIFVRLHRGRIGALNRGLAGHDFSAYCICIQDLFKQLGLAGVRGFEGLPGVRGKG